MTGHSFTSRRPAGFTMVELIIVMVLVGILAAIGSANHLEDARADKDKCGFTYKPATTTAAPVIADITGLDCK